MDPPMEELRTTFFQQLNQPSLDLDVDQLNEPSLDDVDQQNSFGLQRSKRVKRVKRSTSVSVQIKLPGSCSESEQMISNIRGCQKNSGNIKIVKIITQI